MTVEDALNAKILLRQYVTEIDVHPFVKGVTFETVWKHKVRNKIGNTSVHFASLSDLILMKIAAGRQKDLEDLKVLKKLEKQKKYRRKKK